MDATGSLINNLSNELQMERTFGFNERAAKNADARTRALFTDLYSPEAKVKQLKDAGLSVGMMYGQGRSEHETSTKVLAHSFLKSDGVVSKFIEDLRTTDYDVITDWEGLEL